MKPTTPPFADPPALPPAGFDPVGNEDDAARLADFRLPPRPDRSRQAHLYALWEGMFSQKLSFVTANLRSPTLPGLSKRTSVEFRSPPRAGRSQTSQNWSGAYLKPTDGNRFARVAGCWTIPTLRPGVRRSSDPHQPFQCSIWVGIDGKKRWTRSMPQVGSEQTLEDDGSQTQRLWCQWWRRDSKEEDALPWTIEGVPVSAGDRVFCSLTVINMNQVLIHVANRTTQTFATIIGSGPVPLAGSSAQWIVERPANPDLGKPGPIIDPGPLYPLPDYGEVVIDECTAERFGSGGEPDWRPRYIRMTQVVENPSRVAVISAPSIHEGPGTVRVTYRRP
jgi:hypothetical protein